MSNFRPSRQLTGAMTPEEKARVVVALDHDARQPKHSIEMGLRTLRLMASDIEARLHEEDRTKAVLQRMKAELTSLEAAIRQVFNSQQDLVDAVRLELDDSRCLSGAIRADDLIERVCKSNRGLAINAELRGTASRLAFVADERWVERILNNLIANALSHSGCTKVLLCARAAGNDVVFEVRDNGRGMPAERVARVFDAIKASALAPVGHSSARSGLGLYIVRLLTDRLGGTVDCASSPGRGTRFRVRLPGPIERVERQPRVDDPAATLAVRNKMVATLHDDLRLLRSAERVFQRVGVDVYADHDPLRWLNVVTDLQRRPDLILLDHHLRGRGCALQLDIVRRKWMGEENRVILLSGDTTDPEVQRTAQATPVLSEPLGETEYRFIVDVLSGARSLPGSGFVLGCK